MKYTAKNKKSGKADQGKGGGVGVVKAEMKRKRSERGWQWQRDLKEKKGRDRGETKKRRGNEYTQSDCKVWQDNDAEDNSLIWCWLKF